MRRKRSPICAPGFGAPVAIFTLFLGKAIPGREDLTDKEWRAFLDTTVTANLPNGYTVLDANGGWMNPITHKTFNEGTKVLVVALPRCPTVWPRSTGFEPPIRSNSNSNSLA